jgi:pyruvate kinase
MKWKLANDGHITGTTAGLVSKYRPPVPILTLVVPTLQCKDGLAWTLKGRSVARMCLIQRGILPVLAAPSPSGFHPPSQTLEI